MSLILCRYEPVKHPYFIERLGIHIMSSQELCYILYNHPLLAMDGFIDQALIQFIEEELEIWKARAGEKAGEPKKDWQALNQVFFRLMEMWRGSYEVIYQRGY